MVVQMAAYGPYWSIPQMAEDSGAGTLASFPGSFCLVPSQLPQPPWEGNSHLLPRPCPCLTVEITRWVTFMLPSSPCIRLRLDPAKTTPCFAPSLPILLPAFPLSQEPSPSVNHIHPITVSVAASMHWPKTESEEALRAFPLPLLKLPMLKALHPGIEGLAMKKHLFK